MQDNFPSVLPEILFWDSGMYVCQMSHIHTFYQLEICMDGTLEVFLPGNRHIHLKPFECCIIPPETSHYFNTRSTDTKIVSIKFGFPSGSVFQQLNNDLTKEMCRRLIETLNIEYLPKQLKTRLSQYALYNLLHELYTATPLPPEMPPLLQKISSIVLQLGYGVNVKQLADFMNCSVQQLQYRYQLQNNTCHKNLKTYLDAVIISNAEDHLRYSALSVSEIAASLNFPDVYTFSRFFKHRIGMPPTLYRKKQQNS